MQRDNYVYLSWQDLPIFLSLITLVLSILFLICKSFSGTKQVNLPPSPPRLPIIGNLHQIGEPVDRSLRDLSQKYGPLMLLHFGSVPTVVVSSPDMVKEIAKKHDVVFSDRFNTRASDILFYGGKDIVFASYGNNWRQARKLCVQEMLSSKRVLSFQSVREEEVSSLVSKIRQVCLNGDDGAVNMCEMLIRTSNNIMSRCILGRCYSCEEKEYQEEEGNKVIFCETLMKKVIAQLTAFRVGDFFPCFKWVEEVRGFMRSLKFTLGELDTFYNQVFEERKAMKASENGVKDFVDILLQLQKDNMFNMDLTDDRLKAIVQNMFFGGIDTTSTTSEWIMAELMRNPRVMKKTQEEVRRIMVDKGRVDINELDKLDYFKCVVKETLRLHPPVPLLVPRKTAEVVQIGDGRYTIAAGTKVIINAWAIQRDPNSWDQPDEFIPERFENSPVDYYKGGQEYFHFIPFGFGRRKCPGIMFGTVAVEYLMANLLYWFDWKLNTNEDVDMSEAYGITVGLKVPLFLVPIHYSP
uniref:Cytochrome P450 n=1 Tax=Cannabis sativa TaxID=3483 RepID=A0A803PIM2_CANSA